MQQIVISEATLLINSAKSILEVRKIAHSVEEIKLSLLSELSFITDKLQDILNYDIVYIKENIIKELESSVDKYKEITLDPQLCKDFVDFTNEAASHINNQNDMLEAYNNITSIVSRDICKSNDFLQILKTCALKKNEMRKVFEGINNECVDIKNKIINCDYLLDACKHVSDLYNKNNQLFSNKDTERGDIYDNHGSTESM